MKNVCIDAFRVHYVSSETRKIGLMTAKTQFSAHKFCCAPMIDGNDNQKKPMG